MSHNLNFNNGKYSYVGRKDAWHKLGTVLDRAFTSKEALEQGGLDFEVETTRLNYNYGGNLITAPDSFAIVRKDKNDHTGFLGTCGTSYVPIQNNQVFSFFDYLVDKNEAIYECAGALGNGERIWILAKLPDNIVIGPNKQDIIKKYILITNSHTGKHSATAMMTPIRVVCENTLNMAINSTSSNYVRIIHTRNAEQKLQSAHELLGFSTKYYDQLKIKFDSMALSKITDRQLIEYVNKLLLTDEESKSNEISTRKRNQIDSILDLYQSGSGSEFSRGTVWGAYNAVTEYFDHYFVSEGPINSNDRLLKNVWYGTGYNKKQEAMNMALELISL